jgi:ParB family chromosome partitioning protein
MLKRQVLGRGLSALLPEAPGEANRKEYMICKVDELRPARSQPRQRFDDAALEGLAASLRASGVLQPLVVRRVEGGYEIIAGERRWRAARKAGLTEVPVLVKEAADAEALTLALEENLQREDLNPIEEAEALRRLLEEHGRTQEDLARRLGRDRSSIANSLRLLKLPREVQDRLAAGELSAGHGKALLMLDAPAAQVARAREIAARGRSVRAAERLCRAGPPAPQERPGSRAVAAGVRALEERLQRALGTKVRLALRGKGGQIRIDFHSVAELERLVGELTKR